MFESKLWHKKTEANNVKTANGRICQNLWPIPLQVKFWLYFQLHSSSLFVGEKLIFQKLCLGEIGNFLLPGIVMTKIWRKVLLGVWVKMNRFSCLTYVFSSNLNTLNWQHFFNHGKIYKFQKKIKKYSGETNPLGVHRNTRRCIIEVNSEDLGVVIDSMFV